jgi:hypothetical protein
MAVAEARTAPGPLTRRRPCEFLTEAECRYASAACGSEWAASRLGRKDKLHHVAQPLV